MDEHVMNTIEIAVLKEQISGLREQHKAHSDATNVRFDKVDENFKGVRTDIALILAKLNKNAGFWAAFVIISGFVGALFSKIIAALFGAIVR